MDVLDIRPRCSKCGMRLAQPAAGECPSCHADLSKVGIWSEVLEWETTRQMGRTRYVWRRWVLGWGGLLALGWSLGYFLKGDTHPVVYLWIAAFNLLGGYCLGRWYWRAAEWQYCAVREPDEARQIEVLDP